MCSKWFSKYFKAKYLPEGLFEIDETPGIHCSVIVEPIHFLLLRSVQARQRNEFFIVGNNISTLPHYIQYGEPFAKREENTQVTGQLSANHLAFCIAPIDHYDSIESCLLSAQKVLHKQNVVVR